MIATNIPTNYYSYHFHLHAITEIYRGTGAPGQVCGVIAYLESRLTYVFIVCQERATRFRLFSGTSHHIQLDFSEACRAPKTKNQCSTGSSDCTFSEIGGGVLV